MLWFWVPWLGMTGGIVLRTAPEVALAGLAHLVLGGPVIVLAWRAQAAPVA